MKIHLFLSWRLLLVLVFISVITPETKIHAQNYDFHYVQKHNFNRGSLDISYCEESDDICLNFLDIKEDLSIRAGLTISDSIGNLLGYFNGFSLFDSDGALAANGFGFGQRSEFGRIWKQVDSLAGIPVLQTGLILPAKDEYHYAMFSMTYEDEYREGYELPEVYDHGFLLNDYASELLFTLIKLNQDGQLEVVSGMKEIPILSGFLRLEISACKHANGEDWWILAFDRINDSVYNLLLSKNGDLTIDTFQNPGQNATFGAGFGNGVFSPDGSKYAKLHYRYGLDENHQDIVPTFIEVMDFDRCTGRLKNPYISAYMKKGKIVNWLSQIAFSQNGRFLYFANTENVLQFDLFEPDFLNSPDTIAHWDSLYYMDHIGFPGVFTMLWRLPNGTIALPWILTSNIHLIKNPDRKGKDCNFIRNYIEGPDNPFNPEFPFPMPIRSAPYWPEYRMPPLDYSCDDEQENDGLPDCVKILPNPFNNELVIQCLAGNGLGSVRKAEVYSLLGQLIYQDRIDEAAFGKSIDTQRWPSGSYLLVLLDGENSVLKTIKVVKQ